MCSEVLLKLIGMCDLQKVYTHHALLLVFSEGEDGGVGLLAK